MPQPLQNRLRHQTQRWFKPCGVLSLLAGCYLLADTAQAFNPFSQRVMQSHLQAGLAQLSQVNFQPLAFSTEGRLNPVLFNGLKGERLDQDVQFFTQIKQDTPTVDESESAETGSDILQIVEIDVATASGELPSELRDKVYEVIQTQIGRTITRRELQEDLDRIFATGFFFEDMDVRPEDTGSGFKVNFVVRPYPVLTEIRVVDNKLLPQTVLDRIFAEQKGRIINRFELLKSRQELIQWYQDNGYVLARDVAEPSVTPEGVVTLEVAEGVIDAIEVRFINEEGSTTDEAGIPVQGRTQEYVITRAFRTQIGEVFHQFRVEEDFQRVFSLGIFDDVVPGLEASEEDPRKVNLIVNVEERNTGSIAAGLGFNFSGEFFSNVKLNEKNGFGRGQETLIEAQIGFEETTLKTSFNTTGNVSGLPSSSLLSQTSLSLQDLFLLPKSDRENLVNLFEVSNKPALLALSLNNLSLVQGIENDFGLNEVSSALNVLKATPSPILETYLHHRQAVAHRRLGNSGNALQSYRQTLHTINYYRGETDLKILLGTSFFPLMEDEWQIQGSQISKDKISPLVSLIEAGILLDIASTYSVLGDHQAGLYVTNSPVLKETTNYFGGFLQDALEDKSILFDAIGFPKNYLNQFNSSQSENPIAQAFEPLVALSGDFSLSLFRDLPSAYRLQSSKIIYADNNDPENFEIYDEIINQKIEASRDRLIEGLYGEVVFLTSKEFASNIQDEAFRKLLLDAGEILDDLFDRNDKNWDLGKLAELAQVGVDYFVHSTSLENSESINLGSEEPKSLQTLIRGFQPFLQKTKDYLLTTGSENDLDQKLYDISNLALELWPNDIDKIQVQIGALSQNASQGVVSGEFKVGVSSQNTDIGDGRLKLVYKDFEPELLKGFLLRWQGDQYFKVNDYQSAFNAYQPALDYLKEIEKFLDDAIKELEEEAEGENVNVIQNPGSLLIKEFLKVQILDIYSNFAHVSLQSGDSLKALELYEALLEEVRGLPDTAFIYRSSEISEIYLGMAKAHALNRNFDAARVAIEQAIANNGNSFPTQSLSGGNGILNLTYQYGFGVPYQGKLEGSFEFKPKNPWLAAEYSNQLAAKRRCATVTAFFACRQNYFDFYINLLWQQHQANPSAGFDVQAWKASEQARAFSFQPGEISISEVTAESASRSLASAQASLEDDETTVLEFFLGEERSFLWVFTRTGNLQTYELPPRSVIEAEAQTFYELLTSPPGRVRPQTTAQAGQQLSNRLFKQIADQLGTQRLVIVADGFLQYLPFSILPNPTPDNTPSEAALAGEFAPVLNPLLLDHEIVYLPSAARLVTLREQAPNRPQPTQELAFFANPVFNHKDERVEQVKLF
jgi:hypothetical protein